MVIVTNKEQQMIPGKLLDAYLEHIRNDYRKWADRSLSKAGGEDEIVAQMTKDFCNGLSVSKGSKYMKVISGGAVHSFIVLKPAKGFVEGDILKAASYAAPALNFKRGNVLTGDFSRTTWTGAQ